MSTAVSEKELSLKLNKMKQKEENKRCFDCGEKGTTYVCINFGTFICSRCAGILRELNFKVKGIGVTIFNQKEIEILENNGNSVAKKIWLAKYKKGKSKVPSITDDKELTDFLIEKYEEKKWYKNPKKKKSENEEDKEKEKNKNKKNKKNKKYDEESDIDEDKEESESDSEKEKKKKKDEKKKKRKKKKEKSESESDEEDKEDDDDSEKEKKEKKKKKKNDESSSSSSDEEEGDKNNKKE